MHLRGMATPILSDNKHYYHHHHHLCVNNYKNETRIRFIL